MRGGGASVWRGGAGEWAERLVSGRRGQRVGRRASEGAEGPVSGGEGLVRGRRGQ